MSRLQYAYAKKWEDKTGAPKNYAVGDVVWDDSTGQVLYYRAIAESANARPPNTSYWEDATGVYVLVTLMGEPVSRWEGKSAIYDVIDRPDPPYIVERADRSGSCRFHVSDNLTRAALINLLKNGDALRVVKESPRDDSDWCQTPSGIDQMDVPAWIATSFSEEWREGAEGRELWFFVEWTEVTDKTPELPYG